MKSRTPAPSKALPYAIQPLGPDDRARIRAHLLALDLADRALRFGVASDADAVARYVDAIDFDGASVLGAVAPDASLIGLAHVALDGAVADLGISVSSGQRQRGVARALAGAALREAERLGAREFRFDSTATNRGMRRLAQQLGMQVTADGTEMAARRALGGSTRASRPRPEGAA